MGATKKDLENVQWDLHENPQEEPKPFFLTNEVNPTEFGLEPIKAQEMVSGLNTVIAEREVLKNAYIDVIGLEITSENLSTFKELRLKIVKNRTQGIEKWHKTNKAFYLAGGRFVDAIKNKEIAENERMWSEENGKADSIPTDASGEMRGAGISQAGIEADMGALADDEAPPEVGGAELGATPVAPAPAAATTPAAA